jgi:hypothetical protein
MLRAHGDGAARAGACHPRQGRSRHPRRAGCKPPVRGAASSGGTAEGAACREREGEDGEKRGERKLTSGLNNRWQPLTGIQPRARRGGREGGCCVKKKEWGGWGTPRESVGSRTPARGGWIDGFDLKSKILNRFNQYNKRNKFSSDNK